MSRANRWIVLAALLGASGCGGQSDGQSERQNPFPDVNPEIVGGTTALITDYPWQVSFQTASGSHFCGGTIIADQWILTAQHCTDGQSASNLRIVAGITKRSQSSSGQIRSIAAIIPYPGYTTASAGKDVSLLKLSSPLDLTGASAKAIPLATAADASAGLTAAGVMTTVTGWGTTSSGATTLPDNLMQVSVPIVSNADAQAAYGSGATITADQLAAGYLGTGGKDSCQGDSGGPLVVKDANGAWKLAGVVSWGSGCADPAYPGLYARVSSFESWIASQVSGTTPPPPPAGALTSGQAVTGLAASTGAWLHYYIDVPSGTTSLVVSTSGGTGDADLYVKAGSQPTTSSYDCRPYKSGNAETCTIASPAAGRYYVSLYAYATFSGVSLTATASTSSGGYPGVELSRTGLSGATSSWQHFTLAVPADATSLSVAISGGTGDADLYVRKGAQPTTTSYDCRPYKTGNAESCSFTTGVGGATWYVSVRGYSAYSGVTLTADYAK